MVIIDNAAAEGEIRRAVSAEILHIRIQNTRKDKNGDLASSHLCGKLIGKAFASIGKSRIHPKRYAIAHADQLDIVKSGVDEYLAAALFCHLIDNHLEL